MAKVTPRNMLTGALVVCAIATTGMVGFREFTRDTNPAPQAQVIRLVSDFAAMSADGIRTDAGEVTDIVVVEFADVQCAFCAAAARRLEALASAKPNQFTVVHRHYPLERHPYAFEGAVALECAHEQQRFSAMRRTLFEGQANIGTVSWREFADVAGVEDLNRFAACLSDENVMERVRMDQVAGDAIEVAGTPTFIINGRLLVGETAVDTLEAMLHRRGEDSPDR